MKSLITFKYSVGLMLPLLTWYSFSAHGWHTYLPLIYVFVLIPLVELFIPADVTNVAKEEEKGRLSNILYDMQIYVIVPIQLFTLVYFLFSLQEPGLTVADIAGRTLAMGLCCGILGINVGHELGHRTKWYEKWMAKINLMTSLNMHFMHEHNKHHHKVVSTPEDPASAKYGEVLYFFWLRSMTGVYVWAWKLEHQRLKHEGIPFLSLRNQMITDHLLQGTLLLSIAIFFGLNTLLCFLVAALIGHLLLETINYIEHYGLRREMIGNRYERVMPRHSWNSDHVIGRLHLFDLSRHSDHHYRPGRKYQILRHMDESPQMPTGYPGMMILSTIPPLWFALMNRKVKAVNGAKGLEAA